MKVSKKDKIMNAIFKWPLAFFSIYVLLVTLYFGYQFIETHNYYYLTGMVLTPYLMPLLTWRFINFLYPLKDGAHYLAEENFSPWLSSYRIQEIYLKAPFLERFLHFVPFLFNAWLRAWGAKIGKRVLMTPSINIVDRPSLEIGNNVYFGDQCYLSTHFVEVRSGRFLCYNKTIKIGDNCFIGAFTKFGPGANVPPNTKVGSFSYFRVNSSKAESFIPQKEKES